MLSEELPWNLVTKNLRGHELLRKKLRQKISKQARIKAAMNELKYGWSC